MSRNPVRSAIDGIDGEPSQEFLSNLRTQLLAELTRSAASSAAVSEGPRALPPESLQQYITPASHPAPVRPHRRLMRILVVAAACVVVVCATGILIARIGDSPDEIPELHDVSRQEALPLAQRALIGDNVFGHYDSGQDWGESEFPKEAAATIAELPDCALLTSVGLLPPTTKSATAYQYNGEFLQDVFVFATPDDASRAMDVIASKLYPKCWFNVFDRGVTFRLQSTGDTYRSEAWDPPQIAPHGDRQVIIGQRLTISGPTGTSDELLINGFVQVGRAISVINVHPVVAGDLFMVDKGIAAETTALQKVFG